MKTIHLIRSRFDEAYRIRCGYGLSLIRSKREMKALIDFCNGELNNKELMKYNPDRSGVYKETVRLYKTKDFKLYQYIEQHYDWYWN